MTGNDCLDVQHVFGAVGDSFEDDQIFRCGQAYHETSSLKFLTAFNGLLFKGEQPQRDIYINATFLMGK